MAHDWLKTRKCLRDHPKIVRTSSALKADKARTLGAYFVLWCIADEHTVDGRLEGYTAEDVDTAVGIPGFAEAAASVGWLSIEAQAVVIPEFEKHNGQSAKRRAQEANRKSTARKVSATSADRKRPREDQRREELDIDRIRSMPSEGERKPSASSADTGHAGNDDDPMDDRSSSVEGGNEMFLDAKTFEDLRPQFKRVADLIRVGRNELSESDRDTVIRCVVVAAQRLPPEELDAIVRRVRRSFETTKVHSRIGFFKTAVITACNDAGVDFHLASKFDVPRRDGRPSTPAGAVA